MVAIPEQPRAVPR